MATRSTVVAATIAAAAALFVTNSSFTSAAPSETSRTAPVAQPAARAAAPAAAHSSGGDSAQGNGDKGSGDKGSGDDRGYGDRGDNEGRDKGEDRGHENGGDDGGRGYGGGDHDEGRIHFNDRTYSAYPGGCVTAASGLGATSFNIFNESRRTVEVFSGATCDNGGPVAIVGPYGATSGVFPQPVSGGVFVNNGVGASFRVIGYGYYDE